MPNVICTLPKALIIGKEGQRRKAKYTAKSGDHEVTWEDHPQGLIARNVHDEVAKMITTRSGFHVESKSGKTESVETKTPPVEPAKKSVPSAPEVEKAAPQTSSKTKHAKVNG